MKDTTYATDIRKARRDETNEFFTPASLVEKMLDKLPEDTWQDLSKTYIDPAAGNFNFLVAVLKRKLQFCKNAEDVYKVFSNIYATELMYDNVEEGKKRMLETLKTFSNIKVSIKKIKSIMNNNLVCADFYKWNYQDWKPETEHISNPLF